jgi:hypothetical protein
VHALQGSLELVDRHAGLAHPQHQGAGPVAERLDDRRIHVLGRYPGDAIGGERLGHLPAGLDVAKRVGAPHEGPLAGQRRFRQLVQRRVQRPDGDAVIGRSFQQPLGLVPELPGVLSGAFR